VEDTMLVHLTDCLVEQIGILLWIYQEVRIMVIFLKLILRNSIRIDIKVLKQEKLSSLIESLTIVALNHDGTHTQSV